MARPMFCGVMLTLALLCASAVDAAPKVFGTVALRDSADYMYTSKFDNRVYVATGSGNNAVQIVDLDTMTQVTSIQLPAPQNSGNHQGTVTPGQKYLYCSTAGNGVNAYSLKDGTLAWSYPVQDAYGPAYNSQLDEVMFTFGGVLYGLDASTGALLWNNTDHDWKGQALVTNSGNHAVFRTGSGDLVGLALSSSPPTKAFIFKGVQPQWTGSALQAFEGSQGDVYVMVGTGSTGILKIEPNFGKKQWEVNTLVQPAFGSYTNNLMMTEGNYNVWAYNGSNIAVISTIDGTTSTQVGTHSDYVNGLVKLNGDILSIANDVNVRYFSDSFDTYTGKFAVPNGTVVKVALPTKGGSKVVMLTDAPSVVVLEHTN